MKREQLPFLDVEDVEMLHALALDAHGGSAGFIDRGRLVAAVEAVRNGYHMTLAEVAAAYGFGIAKAHAFLDGNKRAAFLACWQFVCLCRPAFAPLRVPDELAAAVESVAAGTMGRDELVAVVVRCIGLDEVLDP